ncbi:hypothetical protein HW132_34155 [Brasilonema sp. CT11]|nr:hypothetical protein [Brasilonema sp. CT11]
MENQNVLDIMGALSPFEQVVWGLTFHGFKCSDETILSIVQLFGHESVTLREVRKTKQVLVEKGLIPKTE